MRIDKEVYIPIIVFSLIVLSYAIFGSPGLGITLLGLLCSSVTFIMIKLMSEDV